MFYLSSLTPHPVSCFGACPGWGVHQSTSRENLRVVEGANITGSPKTESCHPKAILPVAFCEMSRLCQLWGSPTPTARLAVYGGGLVDAACSPSRGLDWDPEVLRNYRWIKWRREREKGKERWRRLRRLWHHLCRGQSKRQRRKRQQRKQQRRRQRRRG